MRLRKLELRDIAPGERTFYELAPGALQRIVIPTRVATRVSVVHMHHSQDCEFSIVSNEIPGTCFLEERLPMPLGKGVEHTLVITNTSEKALIFCGALVYYEEETHDPATQKTR